MRIAILASASAAIAVAVTLFDPTPAKRRSAESCVRLRAQRSSSGACSPHSAASRQKPHVRSSRSRRSVKVEKKLITKTPLIGTGSAAAFAKKGDPQLKLGRLPISTAVAGTALRAGRVGLPRT